ncbi:WYL domain-containing protein [Alicyclobacillus cellulosilyticus]|uniref:WYL domain-containing protein n=1 Tax=Alicyclobacillus cellulosilyticus TaxID=1003997 RepID=A0A917KAK3_9BACL|nr:YafY family protein [Alicyclobacillus cellulosilyticus]GGJ03922.1 WYL domain-containing protein [Alicyclobacillus cellulosilyticus]
MRVAHELAGNERVLQVLLSIVQQPRVWTAKRLAEHFGVSVRTIHRDLSVIERAGFRVESEPGGGYFIMLNTRWLPVRLTPEEQLALLLVHVWLDAIPTVRQALLHPYESALQKLAGKAGLNLDAAGWNRLAGLILPEHPEGRAPHEAEVLAVLLQAMTEARTVRMEYHSFHDDERRERLCDPYYLVPRQHSLYLFGFCHLREAYRIFKVSRILAIQMTSHHYVKEDDFDLARALATAWNIDTSGPEVEAELAVAPELRRYVEEELAGKPVLGTWSGPDGRWHLAVRARINPEFTRWILQFGAGVEVLQPPALREAIAAQVREMGRVYGGHSLK